MKFTIPHPSEGSPSPDDEIAWRRELVQLRVRVKQLEAERKSRQLPSLDTQRDGKHSFQCGNPCGVSVYEKEPLVECQACGAELDPIDVLRDYAHHERNFCYSLEHLRQEKHDLEAENAKLKRLNQRLRGQARKMLPEPPVDPQWNRKWDRDYLKNKQLDQVLATEPDP